MRARWTETWAAPSLVAVLAILTFLPGVGGQFVWDDHRFLAENPHVTQPDSWLRFLTDASTVDNFKVHDIVRPLRTLEFALDWKLFGADPRAFHLHSLLWHAAASALMVLVMRRLLGDGRAAVVAGLVWALHPAQTESVAWISSRGDVAMGALALLSLLFALRSDGFDRGLAISLAAAALAMLYKEAALGIVVVVAALRVTRLSRVPWWPYVVVAVAYASYRKWALPSSPEVPYVLGGSVQGTFATMFRAFGFYVVDSLLPAQALEWFMTPSTSLLDFASLAWLAMHVAILGSAIASRRRAPTWTVSVAWFYGFLVVVANWPWFLGVPTAERFLYLPLGGFALLVGWCAARVPATVWPSLVVAASFAVGSASRTRMWHDDDVLWDAVAADHESARARIPRAKRMRLEGLGLRDAAVAATDERVRAETMSRAVARLEAALDEAHLAISQRCEVELTPRPRTELTRAAETIASNVAYLLKRDAEALFHAEEALRIHESMDGYAQYDRAMPLLRLGFAPQALAAMRRARELEMPEDRSALGLFFLRGAKACDDLGLPASARSACEEAVSLLPAGPAHQEADSYLATLKSRLRSQQIDAEEQAEIERLDRRLAALPRRCPAPRGRWRLN